MNYKKHTLKNGLRVILAPMRETGTVTVFVMTGVGSRYETRKESGLAHFLEHMFFKGTTRRPTTLDITRELDGIGASYNAFTGKEYTGYYAKVEAHHWGMALDVIADLFLHAKLEQEEIDREKGTILQEINMYEDEPASRVGEVFEELLYGDHQLGWRILGPKENIKAFKRADFVKYLRRGYVAENVVVGVAGNVDPKAVKREVMRHFQEIRTGEKPSWKAVKERQSRPMVAVAHKKTDQTHLILGVRTYAAEHPDRYALAILSTILGGGMSSRLFIEVRERRGLAYHVSTGTDAYHDAGYLATQCGVEHENLDETIRVILAEYRKIATEKVGKEELTRAKEYIKGKMALGLEGSDDVVEYLVSQETLRGKIVLPKEKVKMIERVTENDVLRVAKDIFQDRKLNLAVIGPHERKVELEKLLNLGIQTIHD
jgi:predicted Zn-dependent peptidase